MDGEISPEDLAEKLDNPGEEPLVVDIREPRAFERERIPGSVNVPLPRLPQEVEQVSSADHVVTVCPHGKSSVRAARLVASAEAVDATVESMAGGLEEWKRTEEGKTNERPDAPF